jgi:hypothetical protein
MSRVKEDKLRYFQREQASYNTSIEVRGPGPVGEVGKVAKWLLKEEKLAFLLVDELPSSNKNIAKCIRCEKVYIRG